MLTGGNAPPYPRHCAQDCHLGPEYAHGRANDTAPWYYAVVNVGATIGGDLAITAGPLGNYAPIQLCNPECVDCGSTPSGPWIGAYYTLATGQADTAPAPTWSRVQTLTAAAITHGGTGYMPGDQLTNENNFIPTGLPCVVTVETVDGSGAIVTAAITTPGQYYHGFTPTTLTGGHGSGAAFSLTFAGAVINFG